MPCRRVGSPAPDTVNGRSGLDGVVLPTEYRPNVEKAMAYNPDLATNYLRHTLIGDPLMDDMAEELAPVPQADLTQFIHAGMEQDVEAMRAAPKVLRDFLIDYPPSRSALARLRGLRPGHPRLSQGQRLDTFRIRGRGAG